MNVSLFAMFSSTARLYHDSSIDLILVKFLKKFYSLDKKLMDNQ